MRVVMKQYDLILSDPPWKQTKGGLRKCRPNQGKKLDYETLSLDAIKSIHKHFADSAKENHILFCWTIEKFLPETEKMLAELGYKLHARMIWDKTNGVAPAFTVRYSHEYLLYCYKGKFTPVAKDQRGKFCTVFREPATTHSTKPQIAYDIIEKLYPTAEKVELFARNKREGWDSWGNEIESDVDFTYTGEVQNGEN